VSEKQPPYVVDEPAPTLTVVERNPVLQKLEVFTEEQALERIDYIERAASVEPITIVLTIQPALGAVTVNGVGVSGRVGGLRPSFPASDMDVLNMQIDALRAVEQQLQNKRLEVLTAQAQSHQPKQGG